MSDIAISEPLGAPAPLESRAIERALSDLWKQATSELAGARRGAPARTRVLNLIVVTRGAGAARAALDTVARLTPRHPHRAIVVNALPHDQRDQLAAWVQAHRGEHAHGRPLSWGEQITIEAHGPAIERVPNAILPLLVPDVPVMLWWMAGAPFDDPRFTRFGSLIDRVVVDSATFDAPEAGLARMAELLAAGMRVSDLAWSRLTPWRELTAQFFDAPAQVAHLRELTSVTVSYEASDAAADRSQALLLVGWLAARLGWRVNAPLAARADTSARLRRDDGSEVLVRLRPAKPKDDELDRLAALRLESPRALFSVARDRVPNCAVARAEVQGMPALVRRVRLEHLDQAELIGAELRLLGRDVTFAEAARVAAELAGLADG
ncbi:glucose-6-phosphate dehydrogenase assembly protein OpcA [Kouleothrix sp.]|uniref:glucose-6-phosphate dehydrogenase assembly protein OpcA n=1 Tax=Kouleothrix sp. TaxID=2779161 RepID=UPI00391975F7